MMTYWAGKTPCWVVRSCPDDVRRECQAFRQQDKPCWGQDTPCKRLLGAPTCLSCKIWLEYAHMEPVEE
jgi:hypothetical protein